MRECPDNVGTRPQRRRVVPGFLGGSGCVRRVPRKAWNRPVKVMTTPANAVMIPNPVEGTTVGRQAEHDRNPDDADPCPGE